MRWEDHSTGQYLGWWFVVVRKPVKEFPAPLGVSIEVAAKAAVDAAKAERRPVRLLVNGVSAVIRPDMSPDYAAKLWWRMSDRARAAYRESLGGELSEFEEESWNQLTVIEEKD